MHTRYVQYKKFQREKNVLLFGPDLPQHAPVPHIYTCNTCCSLSPHPSPLLFVPILPLFTFPQVFLCLFLLFPSCSDTVSGRSRHTELEFSLARKPLLRDLSKINSFSLEGLRLPNKYKISLHSLVKMMKYGGQNKHPKDLSLTMRSVNLRSWWRATNWPNSRPNSWGVRQITFICLWNAGLTSQKGH